MPKNKTVDNRKKENVAKDKAAEHEAKNLVKGDDQGHDVFQQAREIRGEPEPGEAATEDDSKNTAGVGKSKQAAQANYTDEQKQRDLAKEAREEYLESLGLSSNDVGSQSGGKKVVPSGIGGKQYVGPVTCESVHGQTHEKISARIDLPTATGEEGVYRAFQAHHANAMREHFKIDATNQSIDPNLRSRFE